MKNKEIISFIIPCYNSTKTLPTVIEEIGSTMESLKNEFDYEVVLVNDCSPDGTTFQTICSLAETNNKIKGINLARNFGQPSAVMAGLSITKGDYIVCGDDDGQTPFCELPKFIEKIKQGYDAVEAKYSIREKRSFFRKFGTFMNDCMSTWLVNKPKGLVLTSFWMIRRFVAEEMLKYPNSYPYIGGLIIRSTQKICNVEVTHRERIEGESGYSLKKMLHLWLNGFTSFSVKPLRLLIVLGILTASIGFVIGTIVIIQKIQSPNIVAGYSSIMSIMLFLFWLVFMILGMLGEYIGRIFISLNNAPQFVIRDLVNVEEEK